MSDGGVHVSVRTGAPWWLWLVILALLAAGGLGGYLWWKGWRLDDGERHPVPPPSTSEMTVADEHEVRVTEQHLVGVRGQAQEMVRAVRDVTLTGDGWGLLPGAELTFELRALAVRRALVRDVDMTVTDDGETVTVDVDSVIRIEHEREGTTTFGRAMREAHATDGWLRSFARRRALDEQAVNTDTLLWQASQDAWQHFGDIDELRRLAVADAGCGVRSVVDALDVTRDVVVRFEGRPVVIDCDVDAREGDVTLDEVEL